MSGFGFEDSVIDEFDTDNPVFLDICPKCNHSFFVEGFLTCYSCPQCGHLINRPVLSSQPDDSDEYYYDDDDEVFDN